MKITKQAVKKKSSKRAWFDFDRARDAFRQYLISLNLNETNRIILPNYIGYSEREGSGVLDPIVEAKVNYCFYELDESLHINMKSLEKNILEGDVSLIVIIHYFGYVDPNYKAVIALAHKNGVRVLEDQAHSLFTDLVGGLTGRECDASIYSLHKMFPVITGGALSFRCGDQQSELSNVAKLCLDYDISQIARIRVRNAQFLANKLAGYSSLLSILRPILDEGVIPQTFPILIKSFDRNRLYQVLNDEGFGVVSLYHTMIKEISSHPHYKTNLVSARILNLPVHQDVTLELLDFFCDRLIFILSEKNL